MATIILRPAEMMRRTGLSRSTIYLWMGEGTFPASNSLGARAFSRVEAGVDEWKQLPGCREPQPLNSEDQRSEVTPFRAQSAPWVGSWVGGENGEGR